MKKQLIKEAFRLQQLAGIAPINEISDSNTLNTLGAYEDENGKTVVSDLIKNEKFIEDKLRKAGISSSKEYDQDIHGQKIVIFTIEAEGMSRGMQREQMGQAKTALFSPKEIKSVSFPNGTTFTVGDVDMEGGIVISIEQTATGFEVSGYGDGEGYTYYYDQQGNEMEMESAKPGMQKEQNGATKTYYTVNTYGVTEIKPYEAFGFDGTEEWEEVEFEFPSNIIKKYYTTEDGVGKVVADANASEDEVLIDLEEIDTELFY